jgi:hypothetical protein
LREWGGRFKFFDQISFELNSVVRVAPTEELLSTALELYGKASQTEHMLNVVINDVDVPDDETDAAVRYVVEDEQLTSSPLIQEALINLAIRDDADFEVRRLAWLYICKQHARNPPRSDPGGVESQGKFGGQTLRRLRKEFIRARNTLGPRGTILAAADADDADQNRITELLTALANPINVERKEVALTLGEIGGDEVAAFLADALRSEIKEGSEDEDYQVYLASALSNLGGPDAVEGLLRASEEGSARVRLAALSGLDSLATGGAVALTEYPEPVTIESEEMRSVYIGLAERLSALTAAPATPAYVRHKAAELLDTIRISLTSALCPS